MNFDWLNWSNPVALWWFFLVTVSAVNIAFWGWTYLYVTNIRPRPASVARAHRALVWLSGLYVLGCAFRSVLPRADVQRICLFDTWFSTVLVGRSVATVAEMAFVAQWAIVLWFIGKSADSKFTQRVARLMVPVIFVAECFSWTGVITTCYVWNAFEESTWAITYSFLGLCLAIVWPKFRGAFKYAIGCAIIGTVLYVFFMATVDVPMYVHRWLADEANGRQYFGLIAGLYDLGTKWVVVHDIKEWVEEIPWMSLYFSLAVWTSISLCYVPIDHESLKKHRLES